MPISFEEFRKAKSVYSTLIAPFLKGSEILAVECKVDGIKGKKNNDLQKYHIFFQLNNFPTDVPQVWILDPAEEAINHTNIFHPNHCSILKKDLPYLCPGLLSSLWKATPMQYRTTLTFLNAVQQVLSTENFGSPARR